MASSLFRFSAVSMATCIMVSGCASSYDDSSLTPEQKRLHQREAQYNNTIGEGAALLGGLAALGVGLGTGSAKNAALAGAAGALVGGGVGYLVANHTQAQQMTEDQVNNAIAGEQKNIAETELDLEAARKELDSAQVKVAQLKQQLAQGQISADQYTQQTKVYRTEAVTLQKMAADNQKRADSMTQIARAKKNSVALNLARGDQKNSNMASELSSRMNDIVAQIGAGPEAPVSSTKA